MHIFISAPDFDGQSGRRELSVFGVLGFKLASIPKNKANKWLLQGDDQSINVSIPKDSFDTYNIDPPPYNLETSKSELRQLYKDMTTIRYVR